MLCPLLVLLFQIGVDAGPAQTSCDGSTVTLWALPVNPPARFEIQWDGAPVPNVFRVVTPNVTTSYSVTLTDLDTGLTYQDTTTVLVHPGNPDLNGDGDQDAADWLTLFAHWGQAFSNPDLDPDGDGRVSLLDWFRICNFDVFPPNTPPTLSVSTAFTVAGDSVVVPYQLADSEQLPSLHIASQPGHGFVTLIAGVLRYSPDPDFVGFDYFSIYASDGQVVTPDLAVEVQVLAADTFTDLYNDIFWPHCRACHIEAVSGGLSLNTFAQAQTGGDHGAGFIPGSPEQSPIYLRVAEGSMPLGFPMLDQVDIERIRLWILRGAQPKQPKKALSALRAH